MFNFFRKRREAAAEARAREIASERHYQLTLVREMNQASLEAITKLGGAISEVAREMASASKANSDLITTWLKSFQTQQVPYTSSFEDAEAEEERQQALAALKRDYPDFPNKLPPEMQLAWELLRSEDPER